MITFHSGPWNRRRIADSGSVVLKMAIYETGIPIPGCRMGYAIYEIHTDRKRAFWLTNVWQGTLVDVV